MVPRSSTRALQRGGTTTVASLRSMIRGSFEAAGVARLAAQHLGFDPARVEAGAAGRAARRLGRSLHERRLGAPLDRRHADVDQLQLGVGIGVAVALLVRAVVAVAKLAQRRGRRGLDRQLEGLAAVAQVVAVAQLGVRQRPPRGGGQIGRRCGHGFVAQLFAAQHHAAYEVAAAVGHRQPQRRQHAGSARAQHPPDLELLGDPGGVHRAGAAERHQRVLARIDAALDGDDAQRSHHLAVCDPHDPLGGLLGIEPELRAERGQGGLGRSPSSCEPAGQP